MSESDVAGQDGEDPRGSENGELASDGMQEGAHSAGGDSLNEIDEIVDHWSQLRQESADEQAHAEVERAQFLQEFRAITSSVIRPTMDSANGFERMGGSVNSLKNVGQAAQVPGDSLDVDER